MAPVCRITMEKKEMTRAGILKAELTIITVIHKERKISVETLTQVILLARVLIEQRCL